MHVTRTIHPIGQGAFYSERLQFGERGICVVYDCGCENQSTPCPHAQGIISTAFDADDKIDLLFISHFHQDHVNGIKELLKKYTIEKVIIPYIDKNTLYVLTQYNDLIKAVTGEDFFMDPHPLFEGGNTQIMEVHPLEGDYVPREPISIDSLNSRTSLNSGTKISIPYIDHHRQIDGWFYQPFCIVVQFEMIKDLQNKLSGINLDDALKEQVKINEIKKAYHDTINTRINQTSMMVFSAPLNIEYNNLYCKYPRSGARILTNRRFNRYISICEDDSRRKNCVCSAPSPSCLYTGDIKLSDDVINLMKTILGNYYIGTFQVPHHGAKDQGNEKILFSLPLHPCTLFFVSYGLNNKYGHPSSTTKGIYQCNGKLLVPVNEYICNELNQKF